MPQPRNSLTEQYCIPRRDSNEAGICQVWLMVLENHNPWQDRTSV
ncbi:hypothetical protein GXM_01340 [Nostoc sphaeroides CCNUC1]|uniref:Uncharacterized protein n=1 Tax=Nostoc sphaeroides CCNUC1 TaxID=2653204 RepID=A0A5P8VU07_9NOSO|nr:hypothetical protein GXM_01340 [Nostoc sphaeroides CCNUC1]